MHPERKPFTLETPQGYQAEKVGNVAINATRSESELEIVQIPYPEVLGLDLLTYEEEQVFTRASLGDDVEQAAKELNYPVDTVDMARQQILKKLELPETAMAAAINIAIKKRRIKIDTETCKKNIKLTGLQREILGYVAAGYTLTEYSKTTGKNLGTAVSRFKNLQKKLGANGKNHIVRRLYETQTYKLN